MPFKSEKQRKYLWANEPEIARDWTDTYGSRIHKLHGGITHPDGRRGFFAGAEKEAREEGKAMSPGTSATGGGRDGPTPKDTPDGNWFERNIYDRRPHDVAARNKHIQNLSKVDIDKLIAAGVWQPGEEEDYFEGSWIGDSPITSAESLKQLQDLTGYTGGRSASDPRSPHYTGPGGGAVDPYPYTGIASQPATTAATTTASTGLGGGHFQVPIDLLVNQQRAAEGGIIGSVGGMSRPKYQQGNMVGEGIDFEGAMLQSKEIIAELYNALIAQGLSPQEAMEELKRMFEGIRAQGPEEWPRSPDQGPAQTPMPQLGIGLRDAGPQMSRPPAGRREFPRTQSPAWPGGRELLSEQLGDWEFAEGVSEADKKDANQ
ncbi:uncharacterized protein METZ01_LOCUS295665, partial [marine metagenome]